MRTLLTAILTLLTTPAVGQPVCDADIAEPIGVLDGADQAELVSRAAAMDPSADWDDSGTIDFFDVLAFLRDFDACKPPRFVVEPVLTADGEPIYGYAIAINENGDIAGHATTDVSVSVFQWMPFRQLRGQELEWLQPPAGTMATAQNGEVWDINDHGDAVGFVFEQQTGRRVGVVWHVTDGPIAIDPATPGASTWPFGINNHRAVTGWTGTPGSFPLSRFCFDGAPGYSTAFLWSQDNGISLISTPSTSQLDCEYLGAFSINDAGVLVGDQSVPDGNGLGGSFYRAIVIFDEAQGAQAIGVPPTGPGSRPQAFSVNNNGRILGGTGTGGGFDWWVSQSGMDAVSLTQQHAQLQFGYTVGISDQDEILFSLPDLSVAIWGEAIGLTGLGALATPDSSEWNVYRPGRLNGSRVAVIMGGPQGSGIGNQIARIVPCND